MNEITQYLVPQWISTMFLIVIPLPFLLILLFIKKISSTYTSGAVLVFYSIYLTYITFASFSGWFNYVSLPPRILLYTTFPYAFLLFGVVINLKIYKTILNNAPLENIVKLHMFRVIGVFFILLGLHDFLPKYFAFIAGLGDIITALSSIFVAKAHQNKRFYAKTLTYFWNIFGTIDILFTAIAANVLTKISIDTGVMGVDILASFPFCIIPAFAPPTILFLHFAIFQKMKNYTR